MADPQDGAEALDEDALGQDIDGRLSIALPPDRPLGVEDFGTTEREQRLGESLSRREAREEPDVLVRAEDDRLDGELVDPRLVDGTPADDYGDHVPAGDELAAEDAALHVERT